MSSINDIPNGWIQTSIGEVVELAQGVAINKKTNHVLCDKENGIPLLKINNLLNNTIDQYANPKLVPKQSIIHKNDVIFTRTGQVGEVLINKYGILHNNSFKVIPSEEIHWSYLYWYLKDTRVYNYVQKVAAGSVQKDLNHGAFKTIEFKYPKDIEEQKAIANILTSFDDKIEILQAQNKTLEQTAQTIFEEWFGRYQIGKELPDGWKIFAMNELVKTVNGYSYKGKELLPESDEALVTLKSFDRNGGFQTRGFKPFKGTPKETQEVQIGDLVVAHTDLTQDAEVLGNPAFIFDNGGFNKMYITMDLVKVNPLHKDISSSFLYYLMKDRRFKGHCVGYSNGTTVLHLSKKAIPEYRLPLPKDFEKVKEFSAIANSTTSKISLNKDAIKSLGETRDILSPKLMSGQIRVNDFKD
jgi:type I restriction enzyme S subunit